VCVCARACVCVCMCVCVCVVRQKRDFKCLFHKTAASECQEILSCRVTLTLVYIPFETEINVLLETKNLPFPLLLLPVFAKL
jgi:hypothetical protein